MGNFQYFSIKSYVVDVTEAILTSKTYDFMENL